MRRDACTTHLQVRKLEVRYNGAHSKQSACGRTWTTPSRCGRLSLSRPPWRSQSSTADLPKGTGATGTAPDSALCTASNRTRLRRASRTVTVTVSDVSEHDSLHAVASTGATSSVATVPISGTAPYRHIADQDIHASCSA